MIKRLIQHGNSAALILDKPILDLLHLNIDTPFEITTDGRNLILSPQVEENREEDTLKSLEKINEKYSRVLKKLGE
jgi:antitoxin component of MazEF toxin-antitoxin module